MITLIWLAPYQARSQNFTETIDRTATFTEPGSSSNTLHVFNINGFVTVEGYEVDEIQVTAHKTLRADSKQALERARREISLVVDVEDDHLLIYPDGPFIDITKREGNISYRMEEWNEEYKFHFDLTLLVPSGTNVEASTINRGDVTIRNLNAPRLTARNVNGNILLKNVSGKTRAHTVNGDITAYHHSSPASDSDYQTLNGTIKVHYSENLSAVIRFTSLHGDLYTDFQDIRRLAPLVEQSEFQPGDGHTYRIDRFSPLHIGSGGPEIRFKVLNGDVYIKQIQY
ncbi:MAG: hypothetical protein R3281_00550 [Balneolaceae bacterium]|nr:hypothetical protein [Balneolaceae bacterium]